jgi:hypothetical protein
MKDGTKIKKEVFGPDKNKICSIKKEPPLQKIEYS